MQTSSAAGNELVEVLRRACDELRSRIHAGEACQAETYLSAFPSLATNPDLAVPLILVEFFARKEAGQNPDPQELFARFPQWRQNIEVELETLLRREEHAGAGTTQGTDTQPQTDSEALDYPQGPTPELGPHEVYEQIGKGAMGVVFRARDLVLNRLVALKKLRSETLVGPEAVHRFYREAQAAARQRHPNIVPIYGMGLHGGQHSFTMELVIGGSLAEHLDRFSDPKAAVSLVEKVARALHAAHSKGIIHRDLKPGNILLDEQGEPLVSDFGLAKVPDAPADLTHPGRVLGTPAYMSPEQTAGHSWKVSEASDIWALGVILYELLAGSRPFVGAKGEQLARQVMSSEPTALHLIKPGIDRKLEAIVFKCLQKEPADRYRSIGTLADDLGRWLRGESVGAWPEPWSRRATRCLRRHPWLVGAGAAAILVLLAAALIPLGARRPAEEPAIVLLGDSGPPSTLNWIIGENAVIEKPRADAAYSFGTSETSCLELTPQCPWEHFRLESEVRHDAGPRGQVGIFFAHRFRAGPDLPCHSLVSVAFSDQVGQSSGNVQIKLWRDTVPRSHSSHQSAFSTERVFWPALQIGKGPAPFRKIAIEVSPEGLQLYWDNSLIWHIDRAALDRAGEEMVQDAGAAGWEFDTTGGIGLFAEWDGNFASYRNVVIQKCP
jgi:serine/threonine protein kinase